MELNIEFVYFLDTTSIERNINISCIFMKMSHSIPGKIKYLANKAEVLSTENKQISQDKVQ